MKNIFVLIALAFTVSGCAGIVPASIAGGECKIFHDPGFAVRGKRLKDDQWIGTAQETGIEICGWKRPTAQPAVRARPRIAVAVVATPASIVIPAPIAIPPPVAAPAVATPPKKRHWYDRFRRKPAAQ